MSVTRTASTTSITDILDRILDRGIVIEAWIGVSVVGIRLVEVDTRIVVASLSTYTNLAGLAPADGAAASPGEPSRRARRRRRSKPARRVETLGFRCAAGCTFQRAEGSGRPTSTLLFACPYRRARCRVQALA